MRRSNAWECNNFNILKPEQNDWYFSGSRYFQNLMHFSDRKWFVFPFSLQHLAKVLFYNKVILSLSPHGLASNIQWAIFRRNCERSHWRTYVSQCLNINGLAQERRKSSALAMDLRLSCINLKLLYIVVSALTYRYVNRWIFRKSGLYFFVIYQSSGMYRKIYSKKVLKCTVQGKRERYHISEFSSTPATLT